jgi:hypothetical protein
VATLLLRRETALEPLDRGERILKQLSSLRHRDQPLQAAPELDN